MDSFAPAAILIGAGARFDIVTVLPIVKPDVFAVRAAFPKSNIRAPNGRFEPHFGLAQRKFGAFACVDINGNAGEAKGTSIAVAGDRPPATQHPAPSIVARSQPILRFVHVRTAFDQRLVTHREREIVGVNLLIPTPRMGEALTRVHIDAVAPVIPPVHLIGHGVDVPEANLGTPNRKLESRLATRERLRRAMALINVQTKADHAHAAARCITLYDATALLDPHPLIVPVAQTVLDVKHARAIRQMTLERGSVARQVILMHSRSPQSLMASARKFRRPALFAPVVDPGEIVGRDIPIPQSDPRPAQGEAERRFADIGAFAVDERPLFRHGTPEDAHGPNNEGLLQLVGPPQYQCG